MKGSSPPRLGPVVLGRRPVIAAVVSDSDVPRWGSADYLQAGVLELRVDRFREAAPVAVEQVTAQAVATGRGVLLTVRSAAEGGERELDEDRRLELYGAGDLAHGFDVELSSPELLGKAMKIKGREARLVVGSFHDFAGTPSRDELEKLWARGRGLGVDVVKVACRLRGAEDLALLAAFTMDHAGEGVITVGMGPWGPLSRIVTPGLGSLLSYGFVGESVAPGQLSVAELAREFKRWYPTAEQGGEQEEQGA